MILGRCTSARAKSLRQHRDHWRQWRRRYAWKPVRLIDGRWAWFEPIEITGYVENPEISLATPYNVRIFSTSFCARLAAEASDATA